MFSRTTLRKAILTALAISAASALVFANRGAAPFKCRTVNGKFSLQSVSGPTCTSPVGLCATGSYSGGIKGNSEFTGSSLVPTVDTPTTSVVLLTGDNIIHTDSGDLLTKDAIVLRTTGAGDFAEVDTVVGGTGDLAGATGQFSATGTFTAAGGEAEYRGEICTP
jgi:hypothetical protein